MDCFFVNRKTAAEKLFSLIHKKTRPKAACVVNIHINKDALLVG